MPSVSSIAKDSSPSRRLTLGALVAVLVAVVVSITTSGSHEHRLNLVVPEATNFIPGLDVRAAGVPVGRVVDVHVVKQSGARLELSIAKNQAWPMPQGTRARLRWGGTVSFASRYVELVPGPAKAPPIPDGGMILSTKTVYPVEVDQILRTLDSSARRDLRALADRGGAALGPSSRAVRAVLERTPPALTQTQRLLADVGDDPTALHNLVASSDRVVNAINTSRPGVRALVTNAATTFDALATQANDLETALVRTPGTLVTARGALSHADQTLVAARALTQRLAPGITEARTLTGPAASVLRRLVEVGPLARDTLSTTRRASPDLTALLDRLKPLMPRVESIGRQAHDQIRCIRPYAPEIAGFPSTWGSFLKNGDNQDKYGRIHAQQLPYPEGTPQTSQDAVHTYPGAQYAFPRPPGLNVGKPWFIPGCGVGPDSVDASKDPEARSFAGSVLGP